MDTITIKPYTRKNADLFIAGGAELRALAAEGSRAAKAELARRKANRAVKAGS